MKRYILCGVLCLVALQARTQFLTQSATGQGAVILPLNGVAVGFDIGKTEITVGANNYSEAIRNANNRAFHNWFIGANLSVKNSSGIGNLFKSGDIVPEGNLLGFLGFNVNNNQSLLDEWKNSGSVSALNALARKRLRELFEAYRSDVASYIEASSPMIVDETFRKSTVDALTKKVTESTNNFALTPIITSILEDKDERLKPFLAVFRLLLEPRQKKYRDSFSQDESAKEISAAFDKFIDSHTVQRFTPFIFGGIDARNFSLYTGLNPSSLPKSFADTLYRGGLVGVGFNAQIGTTWLGITYAYIDGDNFVNLTSKEYTLRTTDTAGNQALLSEKKITGYSGKYAKVKSNQLNIDVLKEFKLGDTSRLITNLYYRGSLASRDTSYLKNISNVGLGLHFLGGKSKFLGGLYVELPDLSNNIQKAKPEGERSIRAPLKKLTFGVMTRFSIESILGFVNRPRKPDDT